MWDTLIIFLSYENQYDETELIWPLLSVYCRLYSQNLQPSLFLQAGSLRRGSFIGLLGVGTLTLYGLDYGGKAE